MIGVARLILSRKRRNEIRMGPDPNATYADRKMLNPNESRLSKNHANCDWPPPVAREIRRHSSATEHFTLVYGNLTAIAIAAKRHS